MSSVANVMRDGILLLLSGPMCVGKSWLSDQLVNAHGFRRIRSGVYLLNLARERALASTRTGLQDLGDALDIETSYAWVVKDVAIPQVHSDADATRWLFDSVRKREQVEQFRAEFGGRVYHVHLTGSEELLEQRYRSRMLLGEDYLGGVPYELAVKHPNEVAARALVSHADSVIDASVDDLSATIVNVLRERGFFYG